MVMRRCLTQLKWQAYMSLAILAALLVPSASHAACVKHGAPATSIALAAGPSTQAVRSATQAETPAEESSQKGGERGLPCHDAHCGHTPMLAQATECVGMIWSMAIVQPLPGYQLHLAHLLIVGPDRPPQA